MSSPWLNSIACQLAVELPRVPEKAVLAFARSLPGGFRHGCAIRGELRRRLLAGQLTLEHGHGFASLVKALPEYALLRDLPKERLREKIADIEAILGRARWLMHVITLPTGTFDLNPQEDAAESAATPQTPDSPVVEILPEPLSPEALTNLRRLLDDSPSESAPAPIVPDSSELTEAHAEIARLREQLAESRNKNAELLTGRKRLKEQHDADLASNARTHAAALESLRSEWETERAEIARLSRSRDDLEKSVERRARERFDALYAEEVAPWLARPKAELEFLRSKSAGWQDVLSLAREAESAQREHDRASGNRLELLNTLRDLHEARARLDDLRRTSLHPLASLGAAIDKLDREIASLENRLALDVPPANPVTAALAAAVNAAGSTQRLAQLRTLTDSLLAAGVLGAPEKATLLKALDARTAALLHSAAPISPSNPARRASCLREFLTSKEPGTLFIDGHNLIFDWMPYLGMKRDRAHHPENREALRQAVRTLAERHPAIEFRLVYDGDTPVIANDASLKNLRVEFSGRALDGARQHRADDFIVSTARYLHESRPQHQLAAITDDHAIRTDLTRLGALPVRNDEILALLPPAQRH